MADTDTDRSRDYDPAKQASKNGDTNAFDSYSGNEQEGQGLNDAYIISAIVIGVIFILLLVVLGVYCYKKRQKAIRNIAQLSKSDQDVVDTTNADDTTNGDTANADNNVTV